MISRKLLLLGEMGVGKTSLVRRLVLDEMPTDYRPTMGVDLYRFTMPKGQVRPDVLELVIWDLDGSYSESIFRHVYSRGASAALIVGDITRYATLEMMLRLAAGFEDAMPGRAYALALNKVDLVVGETEIAIPEGLRLSRNTCVRTSALTNSNVLNAFSTVSDAIIRRET